MAKTPKKPGGFRRAVRAFVRTGDKVADRIGTRKYTQIRHGKAEWSVDPETKRPVHVGAANYPTKISGRRPVRWTASYGAEEKQEWRATFDTGATVDFVTWPVPRRELEARAHQERHARYGVYSDDWPLNDLTLLGTLGEDEADAEDGE